MANEYNFHGSASSDMGTKATFSWTTGFCAIGKISGTNMTSAIRVTNVAIPQAQTIVAASIFVYGDSITPSSNQTIKMTIHGFNEDNTSTYSSDPTGRTVTTANYSYTRTAFTGQYIGMDITNIVQEIVNRSGWSSGNAMGFKFENNGTADTTYIEDDFSGAPWTTDAYLYVLLATQPNFYPTPTSVTVPTVTDTPTDWGIKVARSGFDVISATDDELIFSTKFPMLKSNQHNLTTVAISSTNTITHNLGYKPSFLAYGTDASGNRVKFPYTPSLAEPPDAAYSSSTDLKIINGDPSNQTTVYYYIFIDDINL